LFNERKGVELVDSGDNPFKANLYIPSRLPAKGSLLSVSEIFDLQVATSIKDIVVNVLGFIPLGLLIHRFLVLNPVFFRNAAWGALIIGLLLSIGFEILQYFVPGRISSIVDVFANFFGLVLGIGFHRVTRIHHFQAH
jgi:glycopeptide antibiotics resistance protein